MEGRQTISAFPPLGFWVALPGVVLLAPNPVTEYLQQGKCFVPSGGCFQRSSSNTLWTIPPMTSTRTSYFTLISGASGFANCPPQQWPHQQNCFPCGCPSGRGQPDPQSAHLCLPHPRKAGCVLRSESSGLALKSYVNKDSSLCALCIMASQVMEAWSTVPPQVQKRAVNIREREQGLSVHSVRCTEMLHFNFPHEKWPLKSTLQLATVYMAYLSDIFISGSDPRSYIDKCVKNGYKSEECHLECEGQVHGCFGTDHGSDTGS